MMPLLACTALACTRSVAPATTTIKEDHEDSVGFDRSRGGFVSLRRSTLR